MKKYFTILYYDKTLKSDVKKSFRYNVSATEFYHKCCNDNNKVDIEFYRINQHLEDGKWKKDK